MTKLLNRLISAAVLLLLSSSAWPAMTINVIGIVMEGSCDVNKGETINVDFGNNLQARLLDGNNFLKTIDYSLNCEELSSNALTMQLDGTETSFNENYLATDKKGLGIKLYMNGRSMPVNTWIPFPWPDVPVLQAAPIVNDITEVDTGVFTASATLKIQYE